MEKEHKKLPRERFRDLQELAWRVLVSNRVSSLPIDIIKICKSEGAIVFGYPSMAKTIEAMGFGNLMKEDIGFCVNQLICYSELVSPAEQRTTLAHELGHYLMHSDSHGVDNYPCRTQTERSMADQEATAFSDRILCPTSILNFLGVNSAEEIARICNVDMPTAQRRYIRLCRACQFDKKRRSENKRGTFLLNGIERLVYENMKDFIEANKIPRKDEEK